ncbi:MAG: hypothetical protein K2X76_10875 [Sphingomonas sp.]|nr:hypothetical protein [Sphingomonas sp.]
MNEHSRLDDLDAAEKRASIRAKNASIAAPIFAFFGPIALLGATACFTKAEKLAKARLTCLPLQMRLIDMNGEIAQPKSDTRADILQQKVITLTSVIRVVCPDAGLPISASVAETAIAAAAINPNSNSAKSLTETANQLSKTGNEAASGNQVLPAPIPTKPSDPVRIFLQINDPAQRAAATDLGQKLSTPPINSRIAAFQGVERVDAPADNSVRCFKETDLPACEEVVARARQAGYQLTLKDLSARYNNNAGVRPGNVEIWLSPPAKSSQ